jgi:natural product biosynthesis luciferase-like monooxygenase protein
MINFGLLQLFEDAKGKSEKEFLNENIELAEYADDVGFHSIWLAEHHFTEYGVMPSTQVFGSFVAGRTKNIRIGSGVVVLPFHNPVRVAEEFALLDIISDGRLDFGIGRGYQPAEFKGYGIPFEESKSRFDESLEIIQQAWVNGEVNYKGKHYQFENLTVRPRPVQRPVPPFFGASFNADTIKYQAQKKMNLLFSSLSAQGYHIDEYWSTLEKMGENPDDYRMGVLVFVYLDEDREKAYRDFEKPCMWYFRTFLKMIPSKEYPTDEGFYINLHEKMAAMLNAYDAGELSFKEIIENSVFSHSYLVGDPAYVKEKLEQLQDKYKGITDVLCWTRLGGLDHSKVMSSMDLLMNKVLRDL